MILSQRGGPRPRLLAVPPVFAHGRWGPRRLRTSECQVFRVEDVSRGVYSPRQRLQAPWTDGYLYRGHRFVLELRPNRIWNPGRVFFICPCGRRCARLYVPPGREELGCRVCLGLNYEFQSWNYKSRLPGRLLRAIAAERKAAGSAAKRRRRQKRMERCLARFL
jgi:hypothetical protein